MPQLTPYEGRSVDRLVSMINADNQTDYVIGTDCNIASGPLVVTAGPDGRNTKVLIDPLPASGYTEQQEVFYWRLGIDALSRLPVGSVDAIERPTIPFTTHEVLDTLNAALGLDLIASEVENLTYTQEASEYPLTIKAGASYAWLPSTYMFQVTFTDQNFSLGSAITNGDLNGLTYARPPSP